jgi:hypothetical protein
LQRLYGGDVELLAAPLLPPPTDAEEPVMPFAPPTAQVVATGAKPTRPAPVPMPLRVPTGTDPQDERDALVRASFWRSRGECHAALLAWLITDNGAPAPWADWRALAGNQPYVEQLRADWLVLGSHARWQVFDALIARTLGIPAADRAALVRAARSLAPHGASRLKRTLLVRQLRSSRSCTRAPLEP